MNKNLVMKMYAGAVKKGDLIDANFLLRLLNGGVVSVSIFDAIRDPYFRHSMFGWMYGIHSRVEDEGHIGFYLERENNGQAGTFIQSRETEDKAIG